MECREELPFFILYSFRYKFPGRESPKTANILMMMSDVGCTLALT